VSVSGCLTNVYIDTGNFYVGLSLTTNAENMVVVTNVAADGTFAFSHTIMTNSSLYLRLMHFDDVNTNAMWDSNELYGYNSMDRSKGHTFYLVQEARDYDNDNMPDFWEVSQNFNWTNRLDCVGDADSDGFYNVLEYWMKTDPYSANNSSNTAILNAIAAVDEKLVGRTPSTAWTIFSLRNHAATNYVRNTNCWAYSYDLTCHSPWNSTRSVYDTGTLISPRHVLFAEHWGNGVTNGTVMRFVDQQNNVIERTLVAKIPHPLYNSSAIYPDLSVGLLDSDVPTNQISFAYVLPDNYTNYLSRGTRLPALALNQFHKATVCDIKDISGREPNGRIYTKIQPPIDITRNGFYTPIIDGDSGNPLFVFLSGKTVLLTVWTHASDGTSVTAFKEDINEMMTALGGGYQLTEINLSEFRALDE
ncbi:MAG: hypothetical protein LBN38_02410, partial [Verrucomicrobiota bacterium]|nr:hypothetical protein [Verrucomicrobiota bacterium]